MLAANHDRLPAHPRASGGKAMPVAYPLLVCPPGVLAIVGNASGVWRAGHGRMPEPISAREIEDLQAREQSG
jgi:hypothetical protein